MATRTKRYALAIDAKKCIDCKACVVACRAENGVPLGKSRNWINEELRGDWPKLVHRWGDQRGSILGRDAIVAQAGGSGNDASYRGSSHALGKTTFCIGGPPDRKIERSTPCPAGPPAGSRGASSLRRNLSVKGPDIRRFERSDKRNPSNLGKAAVSVEKAGSRDRAADLLPAVRKPR